MFGGAFNIERAGIVHAHSPLRDVDMVSAPVGHLAAGVFIPPAEFVMRPRFGIVFVVAEAALEVIGHRGLAEPHLPVEIAGHGGFWNLAAGGRSVDAGRYLLD